MGALIIIANFALIVYYLSIVLKAVFSARSGAFGRKLQSLRRHISDGWASFIGTSSKALGLPTTASARQDLPLSPHPSLPATPLDQPGQLSLASTAPGKDEDGGIYSSGSIYLSAELALQPDCTHLSMPAETPGTPRGDIAHNHTQLPLAAARLRPTPEGSPRPAVLVQVPGPTEAGAHGHGSAS